MKFSNDFQAHTLDALEEASHSHFQTTKTHPLSIDKLTSTELVTSAFSFLKRINGIVPTKRHLFVGINT
jgi:hypothetical protein